MATIRFTATTVLSSDDGVRLRLRAHTNRSIHHLLDRLT